MNDLRDRLGAANPLPNPPSYSSEKIAATVSRILSDSTPADGSRSGHQTADKVPAPIAAAPRPGAPALSRSRRRWVYAVPVAAGLAGLLAVVGLPGQDDSAYAGWTARPAGVSSSDWAKVGDKCMANANKSFGAKIPGDPDLSVVLAERRGQWTFALLANSNNVVHCLQNSETDLDTSRGGSSGSEVAPRPTARSVTIIDLEAGGGGGLATAYGRAGAEVAKVVVGGPEGGVTATVKGGYWAAWWPEGGPGRATPTPASRYTLTVTLRDGTQLPPTRPYAALG